MQCTESCNVLKKGRGAEGGSIPTSYLTRPPRARLSIANSDLVTSLLQGSVFFASLLGLFNSAELEDTAWITVRRNRRVLRTKSQKTLEWRHLGVRLRSLVHLLNRPKFLY